MNHYQEITLLPAIEVNLGFLWTKVYQQLHLALAEHKTNNNKSTVGVSFPQYGQESFPLGSKFRVLRNVAVIFLVSGLWHGANWTFVVWGGVHAALFIPLILLSKNRTHATSTIAENSSLPSFRELFQMSITFALTTLAWVFFRADTLQIALEYFRGVFDWHSFATLDLSFFKLTAFVWIGVMVFVDWLQRTGEIPSWWLASRMQLVRWVVYAVVVWVCVKNLNGGSSFIYFQF